MSARLTVVAADGKSRPVVFRPSDIRRLVQSLSKKK